MKTFPILIALTAIAAGPARAQDVRDTSVKLDTVVVSATKGPSGSAAHTATVISGAELRATGIARVADALRGVPGAAVAANGSPGAVTSLFLRGGESRYAKVLIDGVPVNSVGGFFDFSHLTTDNVDRIEIVRGPASVVHGADAMTGVVQIFTRRGSDETTVDAGVRAGTYGTREADATVRGGGRVPYSLGAARRETDGILPFNNQYHNGTLSGAAHVSSERVGTLDVAARYTDAEFHYPTDFDGTVNDSNSYRDQHRLVLSLDASRRITGRAMLRLLAGSNYVSDATDDIERRFVCPPAGSCDEHRRFSSRTRRRNAELRAVVDFPRAAWTSGLEYFRERERSVGEAGDVGAPTTANYRFAGTRNTRVAYTELVGSAARVQYTLSGRLDDPSDFGRFFTYRTGLAVPVGIARVRAAFGTAFNAPSFFQLRETPFTRANPDLDPEHARSGEVGIDFMFGRAKIGVTYFDQRFRDLIQFVPGSAPHFRGSYANLAGARARGVELDARATRGGWLMELSGTWLDAEITELDSRYSGSLEVGQRLVRRPPRSASARATYLGWARGSLGFAARYVGVRDDIDFREFPSPLVELPDFTVVDVSGAVRVLRDLSLTLRVENALDKAYQEILYFDAPGRTVLAGVRVGFTR